jgi:hypothetical protein
MQIEEQTRELRSSCSSRSKRLEPLELLERLEPVDFRKVQTPFAPTGEACSSVLYGVKNPD